MTQAAERNTRCITNKAAKQFITPKVCRRLKNKIKYKGIPDCYCALRLILFKIKLLYLHCITPAFEHLKCIAVIISAENTLTKNSVYKNKTLKITEI